MPRDSSGVFTLVDGYLAVTGETIQPSQHNPPLEDIASALTGSLPRNGSAPMLAPLKLPDGAAGAPALTFNSETGTGFLRVSPGVIGVAIGGVVVAQFTAGGIAGINPIGTPVPVLDEVLPPLSIWADGRNVSRSAYSVLFAKYSTRYGVGDGSTTFGMPDLRGRALVGRDNLGGTDAGRLVGVPIVYGGRTVTGGIVGEALNTLLLANMPPHAHPGGSTDVQGQHIHGYLQNPNDPNYGPGPGTSGGVQTSATTDPSGLHGHNVFLPSQGSGAAHNNVQPSLLCNWAIYAGA